MKTVLKLYKGIAGGLLGLVLVLSAAPAAADKDKEIEALKADVETLKKEVKEAAEWKYPHTLIHMAGYANVGYTDSESEIGTFDSVSFAPIFHYQYKDLVMLESELDVSLTPEGEAEVNLEYLTIDIFLNDYMALVAGKFLSPLGQFRQNLHPSWINKLPSAPAGYGHGGAAPIADVGLQLRGGIPMGDLRGNYAVYMGNGPELEAETGGAGTELEGIHSEGVTRDVDKTKSFGGRFGLLIPVAKLEFGASYAKGKAAVTSLDGAENLGNPKRDYDVVGADLAWRPFDGFDVRAEYIKQTVGDAVGGTAPEGGEWKAWYAQVAYHIRAVKLEPVVRYADYDSPQNSGDVKQWTAGLNYVYASNIIAKVGYEFNDNPNQGLETDDRWLVQLAYGF